jgi:hypothetical protein
MALAAWFVMLLAPEIAVQAHFSLGTPVMAAIFIALILRANRIERASGQLGVSSSAA